MTSNQTTAQAVPTVPTAHTNTFAIAAFVLSLMGMYASPAVTAILALIGLRQAARHEQQGFGLAIAALAVSVAVTALHVAMWIHCGRPNFELLTTAHW